ncbi:MAG: elongation factor P [Patescibacteria group bacterium]
MLTYTDLKPGTVFILDGQPYQVLEFNFLRMQQRKPVVQTKIKNLINGKIISRNFQPSDNFEEAEIKYREVKFLYGHPDRRSLTSNGTSRNKFVFCEINDPSKRFEISEEQIREMAKFLKPNSDVSVMEFEGKIININLPIKMDFKVIEAPPSVRGNTAQGGVKAVKIETGAMVSAPLFIEEGDIIKINTQTGDYVERVEKGK